MLPLCFSASPSLPPCRLLRQAMLCLLASFVVHQTSSACSVPVFRYGLEHWTADPYRVVVVHQGPLSQESQTLLQTLKDAGARANVTVQLGDAVQYQEQKDGALKLSPDGPTIIVHAPETARDPGVIWSGPLNAANITALLDSPARQAIATRLGEGESAVFVLLESGDKAADDAAATVLQTRLDYLGTVMELPKLDEQDVRNGLVSLPPDGLRLSFSIVRVSRDDPAEEAFTQILLATEPDLKAITGPIAFPVFGQGRALYALVGKGIRHETIDEAASFLIGSCSCQIKEQNPGADLLMAVDWKALIRNQGSGLEDLPTAQEIVGGMPETVKIEPQGDVAATSPTIGQLDQPTTVRHWAVGIALGILCVVAGAGVFAARRRGR